MAHFEAFYRIVNNADGFCFIDSDPGGWPGSPLSDQARIFNGARALLDRYNMHGKSTKLIDWMWLGWGRHPTGSESGKRAVEFMQDDHPELRRERSPSPGRSSPACRRTSSRQRRVEPREDRVPAVRRDRDGAGIPGDEPRAEVGPGSVRHG